MNYILYSNYKFSQQTTFDGIKMISIELNAQLNQRNVGRIIVTRPGPKLFEMNY